MQHGQSQCLPSLDGWYQQTLTRKQGVRLEAQVPEGWQLLSVLVAEW
jgi:hypothetical protein